jgi:hypothetical protein
MAVPVAVAFDMIGGNMSKMVIEKTKPAVLETHYEVAANTKRWPV